jgi:phage/plasmid-associated DNA primase
LKLFAGEVTITEKKYSKEHQIIENLPIIILSNDLIDEKNKKVGEALFNRIFAVHFKKSIDNKKIKNEKIDTTKIDTQIDEILKEEEPKIIKYCNKVFYEYKYKTKTRVTTNKLIETLKKDNKLISRS